MTTEKAAYYLQQISRKAKAKELPPEVLAGNLRYKKAYDKINEFLRQNYKSYLIWYISGATNRLSLEILKEACAAAERADIFKNLNAALTVADIEEFDFNCFLLKIFYRLKEYEQRADSL